MQIGDIQKHTFGILISDFLHSSVKFIIYWQCNNSGFQLKFLIIYITLSACNQIVFTNFQLNFLHAQSEINQLKENSGLICEEKYI